MRQRNEYTIVGYQGKSGKLLPYKKVGEAPDKYKPGQKRAHLKSFDGKLDFWVDAAKIEDAPPRKSFSGEIKQCWECGCDFDYRTCKENDGDWSDGYCGC